MRLRITLTAVTFVLVSAALPAPASGETAITPANRPTAVADAVNGRLPSESLVGVAPGCLALRAAAPSLALLLRSARAEGLDVATRECYRPLDEQVAVRRAWTARGNRACAASVITSASGVVGTSMHGWGKAVDLTDGGATMTFSSPGYRYFKANAGRYGWNHPGWAEPGGGPCPEPWHWEWVGDGGRLGGDPIRADAVALVPTPSGAGYSVVTGLGAMAHHGDAPDHGSVASLPLNWVVVGAAGSPSGDGYWLVASDGGVFGFGDAEFHGSTGGIALRRPIVAMAATPSGRGYWLVASDGGVFGFGDAEFHGSTGDINLALPIVGGAASPTGGGYWLVAADGGVFNFGDTRFFGAG